jgi:hypothetical protein
VTQTGVVHLFILFVLPPLMVAIALLIGCWSEIRAILQRRTELLAVCASTGFDHNLAFEIADVDRDSIERRLLRMGLQGVVAFIIVMVPCRFILLHLAREFGWSSDTRLALATIVPIAGPLLWSGIQAGRTAEFI